MKEKGIVDTLGKELLKGLETLVVNEGIGKAEKAARDFLGGTKAPKKQKKKTKVVAKRAIVPTSAPRRSKSARFGESTIGVATSYGTTITGVKPQIGRRNGTSYAVYRELLGSVAGSTSYQIQQQFNLNPGLTAAPTNGQGAFAPWAANLANEFIEYRINKLTFEYVPAVATSTAGNIMLAFNADVNASPPATAQYFLDLDNSEMTCAWEACVLKVNLKDSVGGQWKLVRNTSVAGDQHLYDYGTVYVASNNGSAANIGNLFVYYDIDFRRPKLLPTTILPKYSSQFSKIASQTYVTNTLTTQLFDQVLYGTTMEVTGSASTTVVVDPLAWFPTATNSVFVPPAGVYRITFSTIVTDSANEALNVQIYFEKDGSNYPSTYLFNAYYPALAAQTQTVGASAIMAFSGTNTFQIQMLITGAAGTLSTVAHTQLLQVTLM